MLAAVRDNVIGVMFIVLIILCAAYLVGGRSLCRYVIVRIRTQISGGTSWLFRFGAENLAGF